MDRDALKREAGRAAAQLVEDGMVVGLGTGSTVKHTIRRIAERIDGEGLKVLGIPTSRQSELLAEELRIPLTTLDEHPEVDVTIDGADELDARLWLIKGGGGALTREKVVAHASERMVVVADEPKVVGVLGSTFPLPVEVLEFARTPVQRSLEALGAQVKLRPAAERPGPFLTDNRNVILDARWPSIPDPRTLEREVQLLPGVVCCGLFLDLCDEAYVAGAAGVRVMRPER